MKNITISLDRRLAAWVRVEAAKAGKSVSRWLADVLVDQMRTAGEDRFNGLRRLLEEPVWQSADGPMPKRAELYESLYERPNFSGHKRVALPKGRTRAKKHQRAKEWVQTLLDLQSLVVGPQVLNEMYAAGRRKFPQIPDRSCNASWARSFLPALRHSMLRPWRMPSSSRMYIFSNGGTA
jgi:hypothetical protein